MELGLPLAEGTGCGPQGSWRSGRSASSIGESIWISRCRDSMSAGFMPWPSSQSARKEAESEAESAWLQGRGEQGELLARLAPHPAHSAPPARGATTHSPILQIQSSHLTCPVARQPHPYRKTGLEIPPSQSQHHSQPHCPLECLRTRGARGPPPVGDKGRLLHRHHQEHAEGCRAHPQPHLAIVQLPR